MSAKSRPAEVPAAANASETAFWEITPGEGRNLATVSGQKCVRGRAKGGARCPFGVRPPPSAPHDVRLGGTPWPHRGHLSASEPGHVPRRERRAPFTELFAHRPICRTFLILLQLTHESSLHRRNRHHQHSLHASGDRARHRGHAPEPRATLSPTASRRKYVGR